MAEANIILTGFMGTGKTSVGREVAAQLGRAFIDLDDLIAERAGRPISAIFAQDGEATFRALESAICQEVRQPAALVIATGGGAVLDPANREALEAGGTVVCLEADPATIVTRLAGGDGRPLLSGPDRPARIADLLAERARAYAALPNHLDTSRLTIAAAAERVMAIAAGLPEHGQRLIVRTPEREDLKGPDQVGSDAHAPFPHYEILIGEGTLAQAGLRLRDAGLTPGRCAVITAPPISVHYAGPLVTSLAEAGFEARVYEVPDGEEHKTLATAGELYSRFAADKLSRGEPVIALGGGVVGDLAGFVAATWLRGVPFVQIPTSLLAMVDASVGGKVAVDLPEGKNLVGAFKQPGLVLMDPALLRTLPSAEFRAGLAEVLKAALIGDAALFEQIAGSGPGTLTSLIADAVRVKVRVVERDPFEAGERAWLNLGHTFGHALELVSAFRLRHGEAVALGLIAAVEMSFALGYCDRALPVRVRRMMERLGLPASYPFDPAEALSAMGTDKKRRGRALRFVLLKRIGEVTVVEGVPTPAVEEALNAIRLEATTA
jgi:shikimate kinase/3-dehydroquinate synthase